MEFVHIKPKAIEGVIFRRLVGNYIKEERRIVHECARIVPLHARVLRFGGDIEPLFAERGRIAHLDVFFAVGQPIFIRPTRFV